MTEPELPPLYYASIANDLAEVKRLRDAGGVYQSLEREARKHGHGACGGAADSESDLTISSPDSGVRA
jgi:hypothetical protein